MTLLVKSSINFYFIFSLLRYAIKFTIKTFKLLLEKPKLVCKNFQLKFSVFLCGRVISYWVYVGVTHSIKSLILLTFDRSLSICQEAVFLGPLTNIALALKLDKEFASLPKEVYIMGGNLYGELFSRIFKSVPKASTFENCHFFYIFRNW